MFQVLECHLLRDLKRHLTYFSWSPRPYDDLRHALLQFYGIRHRPFPKSDPAPPDTPSSTRTPSAPWPVQTVPLLTTGYTGDGDHPPAPIDPSTERPTILESTASASDVPVLPPEPLPPLSITDSTPATAPSTIAFAAESYAAPLAARGDSTITDEPEARDTAYTTDAEPTFALRASRFANTSAPAAQDLADCQPDHDLSSNELNGSQSFPDVPARISSDLCEEPRPTPSCLSTTQAPSGEAAPDLCTAPDSWFVQNIHRAVDRCTVVGAQEAAPRDGWLWVDQGVCTTSTTSTFNASFLGRTPSSSQ
ncbi:hypothetical protein HPB52_024174 [Rhipicephalus sanguineus]|uniref:Uncharacterized protein n=1 Tax=Rhipicephalus sanguineus TaxID=34632 RepID=A0A9D4PU56_RHISA|nr:hypothetical protein HPB52_024174 [Rhipicephalus sanguineus]